MEETLSAEEYLDLPATVAGHQFQRYRFESIQQDDHSVSDSACITGHPETVLDDNRPNCEF